KQFKDIEGSGPIAQIAADLPGQVDVLRARGQPEAQRQTQVPIDALDSRPGLRLLGYLARVESKSVFQEVAHAIAIRVSARPRDAVIGCRGGIPIERAPSRVRLLWRDPTRQSPRHCRGCPLGPACGSGIALRQ